MACHGRIMILEDRQPRLTVGVTYGFHNMSKYKEHPERCLGLEICKKMEIKIAKTYHVASCCCPQYAHEVSGKMVSFNFPTAHIKDNNNSPHA